MKRFKTMITLLCCIILTGFTPTNAISRNETEFIPTTYQEENRKMIELKNELSSQNKLYNIAPMSSGGKSLYIPGYYQENSYFCGPASVQNVLVGLGYPYKSQATIAEGMGTNSSGTMVYRIAQYLNQNTNLYWAYQSVYTDSSDYKSFIDALHYGIDNNQHLIPNVDAHYIDLQYRIGSGHYIVAYGYSWYFQGGVGGNDVLYFDVYEPFGGYEVMSVSGMVNAISKNHGYYIW